MALILLCSISFRCRKKIPFALSFIKLMIQSLSWIFFVVHQPQSMLLPQMTVWIPCWILLILSIPYVTLGVLLSMVSWCFSSRTSSYNVIAFITVNFIFCEKLQKLPEFWDKFDVSDTPSTGKPCRPAIMWLLTAYMLLGDISSKAIVLSCYLPNWHLQMSEVTVYNY